MKPVSSPAPQEATAREPKGGGLVRRDRDWSERAGRLHGELERPARAMIRRAYRGAFSDEELEDIYSTAWVGTLRTLGRRHQELSDEEIRSYLLTAVANQASKELRRRRRKPTAPLEGAGPVADDAGAPDERAVSAERTRVARDLLASLPPRRRAVMLLRYGWGLEPAQVRELVDGLSPRAYRKEITRGVDELADRMRRFERGEWCGDREPLLKTYAAGLADEEERRQAQAHLAHCHDCSDFVARLGGHLHDLGSAASVPAVLEAAGGRAPAVERLDDLRDRARETIDGLLPNAGASSLGEGGGQMIAAGGGRGAGATLGAGLLAKLGGVGTAGKLAALCLTGGAAVTACVTAGVVPGGAPGEVAQREALAAVKQATKVRAPAVPVPMEIHGSEAPARPEDPDPPPQPQIPPQPPPPPASEPVPPPQPFAPSTPPVEQQFGVAAAAPSGGGSTSSGGQGGGGGGGSAIAREFGP